MIGAGIAMLKEADAKHIADLETDYLDASMRLDAVVRHFRKTPTISNMAMLEDHLKTFQAAWIKYMAVRDG